MSLPEHPAIIEAIRAHDADAAGQAAPTHLRSVLRTLPEVDRTRSASGG